MNSQFVGKQLVGRTDTPTQPIERPCFPEKTTVVKKIQRGYDGFRSPNYVSVKKHPAPGIRSIQWAAETTLMVGTMVPSRTRIRLVRRLFLRTFTVFVILSDCFLFSIKTRELRSVSVLIF